MLAESPRFELLRLGVLGAGSGGCPVLRSDCDAGRPDPWLTVLALDVPAGTSRDRRFDVEVVHAAWRMRARSVVT
jgi:hypothetical protein